MEAHRFPEAEAQFKKAIEQNPKFPPNHFKYSQFLATDGRFDEALKELEHWPNVPSNYPATAKGYAELVKLIGTQEDWIPPIAAGYALAGDKEQAFSYLTQASNRRDSEILMEIRYPALDPLRSDPRFIELMRKLGLPD